MATLPRFQILLANNQLESVLRIIQDTEAVVAAEIKSEAVLLSGRLEKLKRETQRGVVSQEQATLEENRIRVAVGALVGRLQTEVEGKIEVAKILDAEAEKIAATLHRKKHAWVIFAFLYVVVAIVLLWWLILPMSSFRIEADLMVERMSFRYLEGPTNFAQGAVKWCSWQNYERSEWQGYDLYIDDDLDNHWERKLHLEGALMIRSNPEIPGISIRFGPARLEKLLLEPKAMVTLSRPEETPKGLRLSIQQDAALKGEWVYKDSIVLQSEQFTTSCFSDAMQFDKPAQLCIVPPYGQAQEISIFSFPGATTIDLELTDTLQVKNTNLVVNDISFFQPVENVALPTLLSGTVKIAEVGKPAIHAFQIEEGESLDFIAKTNLVLQNLSIRPEGIALRLHGTVTQLETGRYHTSRNPLRLEWLWGNRRILLLAAGLAFVGFALFLLPKRSIWIFNVPRL